jgi:hypothetical protein
MSRRAFNIQFPTQFFRPLRHVAQAISRRAIACVEPFAIIPNLQLDFFLIEGQMDFHLRSLGVPEHISQPFLDYPGIARRWRSMTEALRSR